MTQGRNFCGETECIKSGSCAKFKLLTFMGFCLYILNTVSVRRQIFVLAGNRAWQSISDSGSDESDVFWRPRYLNKSTPQKHGLVFFPRYPNAVMSTSSVRKHGFGGICTTVDFSWICTFRTDLLYWGDRQNHVFSCLILTERRRPWIGQASFVVCEADVACQ